MRNFSVEPLAGDPPFGAVVTGIDRPMLERADIRASIRRLWHDKGVLVFRDVDGEDLHMALAYALGTPGEHPMQRAPSATGPLRPVDVTFDDAKGSDLYEVDGELLGAYQPWHCDWIYMDEIARGGFMRPVRLPKTGGDTGFIDRSAAFDRLPPPLAEKIRGLNVFYYLEPDASRMKFGTPPARCARISERLKKAVHHPRVSRRSIHPLVFEHKDTGRKVLNISPWWMDAIEGMAEKESHDLLASLVDHCVRPENAYIHQWRPREMVIWDNWRMLHCAFGIPQDDVRHMQRIDLIGDYGLGRYEGD